MTDESTKIECVVKDDGCLGMATNPHNPVCTSCAALGWTANFQEMSAAIANDPELADKIDIISPLNP